MRTRKLTKTTIKTADMGVSGRGDNTEGRCAFPYFSLALKYPKIARLAYKICVKVNFTSPVKHPYTHRRNPEREIFLNITSSDKPKSINLTSSERNNV